MGSLLPPVQRQDKLVKMAPNGTARVIRRPKTNPDGSDIVTSSDFDFPDTACEGLFKTLREALGLDLEKKALRFRMHIRDFCGIEVDLEGMKNSYAASSTSGEQN